MALWRGALEQRGLPYVLIGGAEVERERQAHRAIAALSG